MDEEDKLQQQQESQIIGEDQRRNQVSPVTNLNQIQLARNWALRILNSPLGYMAKPR